MKSRRARGNTSRRGRRCRAVGLATAPHPLRSPLPATSRHGPRRACGRAAHAASGRAPRGCGRLRAAERRAADRAGARFALRGRRGGPGVGGRAAGRVAPAPPRARRADQRRAVVGRGGRRQRISRRWNGSRRSGDPTSSSSSTRCRRSTPGGSVGLTPRRSSSSATSPAAARPRTLPAPRAGGSTRAPVRRVQLTTLLGVLLRRVDAVVVFTERDRLAFEQDAHRTTFAVIPPSAAAGPVVGFARRGVRAALPDAVSGAPLIRRPRTSATGAAGAFAEIEFVLAVKPDRALHRRLGGSCGKVYLRPGGPCAEGRAAATARRRSADCVGDGSLSGI